MPELEPYTPTTSGWTATVVNSVMIDKIKKLPVGYNYTLAMDETVTPDVIAQITLGDANYAWIIMTYNNFLDIRELSYEYGTREIRVPNRLDLMNLISDIANQET